MDKKLLVILGPTSAGKTDVALVLAKKFNGELISCDSRQVYKDLDLGTGKLPGGKVSLQKRNNFWILDGVKVWMYDVANPKRQYSVFKYITKANKILVKIENQGKLPIIVGGTGLYLKGLLYGFSNLGVPVNEKLRKKLEKLSLEELQKRLQKLSPERWKMMNSSDRQNPRRLIRAIEVGMYKGKKINSRIKKFDVLKIGLTASREILYKRIDERVISRIKAGMIEETKNLNRNGLPLKKMRQLGLEYAVLADFLQKKITKEELVKILQGKIHAYARRQETWFKKEKKVNWFNITSKDFKKKVENLVAKWYHQANATQN